MAGYRNCIIKFDSPRNVFYTGQVVLGSVVIELDQPITLSVLYVNFLGNAAVDWKETETEEYNGVKRYKQIEYVGREEYFNVTQLLAGGNAPVALPAGTHTYSFSYQIPPGVPSSFTGERGGITYCAKATLDLKQGPPDNYTELKDEIEKYFDVVAPFDLNLGSPQLKEPIELEFEEVYGCGCFCSSEPITIRVRLPASGYCPGQLLPVALRVHNSTSVEVRNIIFEIFMRERYRTQRPVSEFVPPEKVLTSVKKGAIMSGASKNLSIDLKLPDIIVPNLENCEIIDVGYFFRVKVKLSGCNDDFEDEAEICLGLVPLKETLNGEYVHPLSHSLPIGPIPDIPPPNPQEQKQMDAHQQSAYPAQVPFSNTQTGYPNGPPPFSNTQAGYPNGPPLFPNNPSGYPFPSAETAQGSYFVQVQQQQYSSTDPSKNFNIGFTMTSPPGAQPPPMLSNFQMPPFPNRDLRIHLPPPSVNVNTPTAPPPSS